MPTIRHFVSYLEQYGTKHKALYLMSLLILFWSLFDGIMSYITPIIITENGISTALMGMIIGSSSIAGALFDFVLCKMFKSTFFRRVFIVMFLVCAVYPLILWQANSFIVYIIAMAMWGIYYDLKNFGIFDFVSRHNGKGNFTSGFGVVHVFQTTGYLLAPIFVGVLIADALDWKPFVMAWIFLGMSLVFFFTLLYATRKEKHMIHPDGDSEGTKRNVLVEARLWRKIGKIILPVLALTLALNMVDSFFWTIGPLFANEFSEGEEFAGLFLAAYQLPSLIIGWFIGPLTMKFGKKRTAFYAFLFGSLLFSLIAFIDSLWFVVVDVFLASFFISASWPAINGAYSDYISEKVKYEKEITGLEDFFTNLGYIFGPMLAGWIVYFSSNAIAFSLLGVFGALSAVTLILIAPKKIAISVK